MARPKEPWKRERLLDAAMSTMVDKGFGGLTVKDVADAAGVSPGTVHYHFSDIDGVLLGVVERALDQMYDQRLEAISSVRDIREKLLTLIELGVPDEISHEVTLIYEAIPVIRSRAPFPRRHEELRRPTGEPLPLVIDGGCLRRRVHATGARRRHRAKHAGHGGCLRPICRRWRHARQRDRASEHQHVREPRARRRAGRGLTWSSASIPPERPRSWSPSATTAPRGPAVEPRARAAHDARADAVGVARHRRTGRRPARAASSSTSPTAGGPTRSPVARCRAEELLGRRRATTPCSSCTAGAWCTSPTATASRGRPPRRALLLQDPHHDDGRVGRRGRTASTRPR